MGGGKGGSAPGPDYGSMIAAITAAQAQAQQSALARDMFTWAQNTYNENKGITNEVVNAQLTAQNQANAFAKQQQDVYTQTYQPMEQQFAQQAQNWDTTERRQQLMGRAEGAVGQQFANQRQQAEAQLESFGVKPSDPKYAATDLMMRSQEGAAKAAAGENAQQLVEQQGLGLRQAAINVGRGYPGSVAQTAQTGLQAGSGAVSNTLAQTQTGAQTMGTPTQYYGLANNALGTWGNIQNNIQSNKIDAYKAQQQSSSGLGGLLGGVLGMMKFEEGGQVPPEQTPPGAVPVSDSPSRGRAVDDVPARLTAGEFVIPKDVVQAVGKNTLYKLIETTRKKEQTYQGALPAGGR